MLDTSRILQKGPEYLRKQMEREREAPGRSAAERLAATKPEYIRNQQPSASETGSSMCSSDQSEATPSSPPNNDEEVDESSTHEVNVVKRNSSKKRPDSLLLYRQKGELQRGASDGNGRKSMKRTLLLSRRDKTIPFSRQEIEESEYEASSGQQLANDANDREHVRVDVARKPTTPAVMNHCEDVARKPATVVASNPEDVARKPTTVVTNIREDVARKPTTVVMNNREDFARKLTSTAATDREDIAKKLTTVVTGNHVDVAKKPITVDTNNQEDVARKPATVIINNREDVAATTDREHTAKKLTTLVRSNRVDAARKPIIIRTNNREDDVKKLTEASISDVHDATSCSERRRNRVSRSHSDISSRYSRSFAADFDTFFTYCGLDDDVVESVGRENFCACSEALEEVFIGSGKVRSVSMAASDDGFSQTGSNHSDGLLEDELPDKKSGQGTSVIERNARVIKWLYSCRNAAQSGKTLRDLV